MNKRSHVVKTSAYLITLETIKTLKNGDCEKNMSYLAVCHSADDCIKVMMKEKSKITNRYKNKKSLGLNQTFEGNDPSKYLCYLDIADSRGNYIEYYMDVEKVKEIPHE